MPSIKEEILKRLKEEDIKPEEQDGFIESFTELSLDETIIESISEEDKTFLEQFKNLETIQLNMTRLKSLENFPKIDTLKRVELAENHLSGQELQHLLKNENISVLRLASNKIATMDEVKILAGLKHLKNLDLVQNPVTKDESYKRDAIFEAMPELDVLDYVYKNGEDYESADEYGDEDLFLGEGGEDEMEQMMAQLSPEQIAKLREQGITPEEYLQGMGEDLLDYGEEGEEEGDDPDGEGQGDQDADENGNAEKKAKTD